MHIFRKITGRSGSSSSDVRPPANEESASTNAETTPKKKGQQHSSLVVNKPVSAHRTTQSTSTAPDDGKQARARRGSSPLEAFSPEGSSAFGSADSSSSNGNSGVLGAVGDGVVTPTNSTLDLPLDAAADSAAQNKSAPTSGDAMAVAVAVAAALPDSQPAEAAVEMTAADKETLDALSAKWTAYKTAHSNEQDTLLKDMCTTFCKLCKEQSELGDRAPFKPYEGGAASFSQQTLREFSVALATRAAAALNTPKPKSKSDKESEWCSIFENARPFLEALLYILVRPIRRARASRGSSVRVAPTNTVNTSAAATASPGTVPLSSSKSSMMPVAASSSKHRRRSSLLGLKTGSSMHVSTPSSGNASGNVSGNTSRNGSVSGSVDDIGNGYVWRAGVNAAVCETQLPSKLGVFVRRLQESGTSTLLEKIEWKLAFRTLQALVTSTESMPQLQRSDCINDIVCACAEKCSDATRPVRTEMIGVANAMVSRCMSKTLVTYFHKKDSLKSMLRSWTGFNSWEPQECVALLLLFSSWLRHSQQTGAPACITDFASQGGYQRIQELMLWIENNAKDDSKKANTSQTLEMIVATLMQFLDIGVEPLKVPDATRVSFTMQSIVTAYNDSLKNGSSIVAPLRNTQAARILLNCYTQSKLDNVRLRIIDSLQQLMNSQPMNYVFLSELQPFSVIFGNNFVSLSDNVREAVLKLVVFVATTLKCVPIQALNIMATAINETERMKDSNVQELITIFLNLLKVDDVYRHVLRDSHIFDGLVKILIQQHTQFKAKNQPTLSTDTMFIMLKFLKKMITNTPTNGDDFGKQAGAFNALLWLCTLSTCQGVTLNGDINPERCEEKAFNVVAALMSEDPARAPRYLSDIIEMLQRATQPPAVSSLIENVLYTMRKFVCRNSASKDVFRDSGGFDSLVSLLTKLHVLFSGNEEDEKTKVEETVSLFESVTELIIAAMQNHNGNRKFFEDAISYSLVGSTITNSGLTHDPERSAEAIRMLNCMIHLATETELKTPLDENGSTLYHYQPIHIALELIDDAAPPVVEAVTEQLLTLLTFSHNADLLSKNDTTKQVFIHMKKHLLTSGDSIQPGALKIVERMSRVTISAEELRMLFTFIRESNNDPETHAQLLQMFERVIRRGDATPRFSLDLNSHGFACIQATINHQQQWSQASGYTVSLWFMTRYLNQQQRKELDYTSADESCSTPVTTVSLRRNSSGASRSFLKKLRNSVNMESSAATTTTTETVVSQSTRAPQVKPSSFSSVDSMPFHLFGFEMSDLKNRLFFTINEDGTAIECFRGTKTTPVMTVPYTFESGRWYNIVISHGKHLSSKSANTNVTIFVNGSSLWTGKLAYPGPFPSSPTITATLGVPEVLSRIDNRRWQLGPSMCFDKPLQHTHALLLYMLGSTFSDNLQPMIDLSSYRRINNYSAENLSNAMNALGGSLVAEMLKNESEVPILDMNTHTWDVHESSLWWNISVVHDSGEQTIINCADPNCMTNTVQVVGDCEIFQPCPLSTCLQRVGGVSVLFPFLAEAATSHEMNIALRTIYSAISHDPFNLTEFEHVNGYGMISIMLKRKASLLTEQIAATLFQYVGFNPERSNPRSHVIENKDAFYNFFGTFEHWKATGKSTLMKYVLQTMTHLLTKSHYALFNAHRMLATKTISRLLSVLHDEALPYAILSTFVELLEQAIMRTMNSDDLKQLVNFTTSLTSDSQQQQPSSPAPVTEETASHKNSARLSRPPSPNAAAGNSGGETMRSVRVCSMLLKVIQRLLTSEHPSVPSLSRLVTTEWLLHFVKPNLPAPVVATAVRIISVQCHFTGKSHNRFMNEFIHAGGIDALRATMPTFCFDADAYYSVLSLILGTDVRLIPGAPSFDAEELFGTFPTNKVSLAMPGVIPVFFDMIRQSFIVTSRMSAPQPTKLVIKPINTQATEESEGPFAAPMPLGRHHAPSTKFGSLKVKPTSPRPSLLPQAPNSFRGFQIPAVTMTRPDQGPAMNSPRSRGMSVSTAKPMFTAPQGFVVPSGSGQAGGAQQSGGSNRPFFTPQPTGQNVAMSPPRSTVLVPHEAMSVTTMTSTDSCLIAQQTLLKYAMSLYDSCEAFAKKFKKSVILRSFVAIFFATGRVTIPERESFTGKDGAMAILFEMLNRALIATKDTTFMERVLLDSLPFEDIHHEHDRVLFESHILLKAMESEDSAMTREDFMKNAKYYGSFVMWVVGRLLQGRLVAPGDRRRSSTSAGKLVLQFLIHVMEKSDDFKGPMKEQFQPLFQSLFQTVIHLFECASGNHSTYSSLSSSSHSDKNVDEKNSKTPDLENSQTPRETEPQTPRDSEAQTPRDSASKKKVDHTLQLFLINKIIEHPVLFLQQKSAGWEKESAFTRTLLSYLVPLLSCDAEDVQTAAVSLCKQILSLRRKDFGEVLTTKNQKGEMVELLTDGLVKVFEHDQDALQKWMLSDDALVRSALEGPNLQNAKCAWLLEHQRIAQSMSKLQRRRQQAKQKKNNTEKKAAESVLNKTITESNACAAAVRTEESKRFSNASLDEHDRVQFLNTLWDNMLWDLRTQNGVWSERAFHFLEKWKLDFTEGPFRMRRKFERDYTFFERYPDMTQAVQQAQTAAAQENGGVAVDSAQLVKKNKALRKPTSLDSHSWYSEMQQEAPSSLSACLRDAAQSGRLKQLTISTKSPSVTQFNVGRSRRGSVAVAPTFQASLVVESGASINRERSREEVSPLGRRDQHSRGEVKSIPRSLTMTPETLQASSHGDRSRSPGGPMASPEVTRRSIDDSVMRDDLIRRSRSNSDSSSSSDDDSCGYVTPGGDDEANSSEEKSFDTTDDEISSSFNDRLDEDESVDDYTDDGYMSSEYDEDGAEEEEDDDGDDDDDEMYEDGEEDAEGDAENQEPTFRNRLERFIEPGETILQMLRCEIAEAMDSRKCVLLVCSENVYAVRDFTLNAENEVQDVADDSRGMTTGFERHDSHTCMKWARRDIREVIRRRYLLRWVALELFLSDGHSHLLVFEPSDVEVARKTLKSIADATPFFSTARMLVDMSASEALGGNRPSGGGGTMGSSLVPLRRFTMLQATVRGLELTEATQQWVDGKISNFQYLIYLNTVAGRSYNDITQYPVFPWVLCDYTSDKIDLSNSAVYRDLSKPIGALDPARAAFFRERYSLCEGVTTPHHYSHHYSSAAVVVYYLLRLEPFTKPFLDLNGGHWDWPDRLFHNVDGTWKTLTVGTMPQVMELTPEFFYLPEFLENRNRFAFGSTERDGKPIDGVELPPWCHGSAREFVRINLQALESPYVSEHLNEWIDLIFGYKQRGQAAVDAVNVFNQHSYEGAVDVDAITDEVERRSTIATIREFGQTPQQLWDKAPHPRRSQAALQPPQPPTWSTSPALVSPTVVVRLSKPEEVSAIVMPSSQNAAERPPYALSHGVFISFSQPQHHALYGHADRSVRLYNGDKLQSVIYPCRAQITCAASSGDGSCIVFGAADSTVRVYGPETRRGKRVFALEGVLCGHTKPVSSLSVSRNHSLIVSGSIDGTLVFWDLNRRILVHEVFVAWRSANAPVRRSSLQSETPVIATDVHVITGNVVACTRRRITVWSINGDLLAAVTLLEQGVHVPASALANAPVAPEISCCLFSQEWIPGTGQVLLTGHVDGTIRVWNAENLVGVPFSPENATQASDGCEQPKAPVDESKLPVLTLKHVLYTGDSNAVTTLYIPYSDRARLYAGTANGTVVQITDTNTGKKK